MHCSGLHLEPSIQRSKHKPDFDTNFYTMPFFEIHPSLISSKRVVVHRGNAYVPSSALRLILASRFKERLSAGLDVAFQGLPIALSNPQVGSFLRFIQDNGMQLLIAPKTDKEELGEQLTLNNFEELMVRSFPPCMRRLVEKQRETKKHLKHLGRLQLRPFLKDCGFTIDDSFKWWQQELCKDPTIDATSYEKNYTYDVEHAYGKKGHLQGQNSFGCPKIIGFPGEASGQTHGCLFKELDVINLRHQLHKWKVTPTALAEIEKLIANGKHYQLACIEFFKSQHPGSEGDGVGNTPGDYFRVSCNCHIKKKEKADGTSAK